MTLALQSKPLAGATGALLAAKAAVAFPLMAGRIWHAIAGTSRYLISSDGEIISLVAKPRLLKGTRAGKYLAAHIALDDGTVLREYVHRLVLRCHEREPDKGEEARHLDGNRENSRLSNLAWGTRLENHADKIRHGTTPAGAKNPQARLTGCEVEEMRLLYASGGWTFKRLAQRFGVTAMSAHRAVRRHTWK